MLILNIRRVHVRTYMLAVALHIFYFSYSPTKRNCSVFHSIVLLAFVHHLPEIVPVRMRWKPIQCVIIWWNRTVDVCGALSIEYRWACTLQVYASPCILEKGARTEMICFISLPLLFSPFLLTNWHYARIFLIAGWSMASSRCALLELCISFYCESIVQSWRITESRSVDNDQTPATRYFVQVWDWRTHPVRFCYFSACLRSQYRCAFRWCACVGSAVCPFLHIHFTSGASCILNTWHKPSYIYLAA